MIDWEGEGGGWKTQMESLGREGDKEGREQREGRVENQEIESERECGGEREQKRERERKTTV